MFKFKIIVGGEEIIYYVSLDKIEWIQEHRHHCSVKIPGIEQPFDLDQEESVKLLTQIGVA